MRERDRYDMDVHVRDFHLWLLADGGVVVLLQYHFTYYLRVAWAVISIEITPRYGSRSPRPSAALRWVAAQSSWHCAAE